MNNVQINPDNKPLYVLPVLIFGNNFFPLINLPPRYEKVSKIQIVIRISIKNNFKYSFVIEMNIKKKNE